MDYQNYDMQYYPPQPPIPGKKPGKGKHVAKIIIIVFAILAFMTVSAVLILAPAIKQRLIIDKTISLDVGKNDVVISKNKMYVFTPTESGYYSFSSASDSGIELKKFLVQDVTTSPDTSLDESHRFSITHYCNSGQKITLELEQDDEFNGTLYINKLNTLSTEKNNVSFISGTIYPLRINKVGFYTYSVPTESGASVSLIKNGEIGATKETGCFNLNTAGLGFMVLFSDSDTVTKTVLSIDEANRVSLGSNELASYTPRINAFVAPEDGYYHFTLSGGSSVKINGKSMKVNYYSHSDANYDYVAEFGKGDTVMIELADDISSAHFSIESVSTQYYNAFVEYCSLSDNGIYISSSDTVYKGTSYSSKDFTFRRSDNRKPSGYFYDKNNNIIWLAFGMNTDTYGSILVWYPHYMEG